MALLGTIDEVVCSGDLHNETVKMVESFLPGTTGVGQRGWYRELKHFLKRDELTPVDSVSGTPITREGPVTFPSYPEALEELAIGPAEERTVDPGTQSRAIYAASVLSNVARMEEVLQGQPPAELLPESRLSSAQMPDPLDVLLPVIGRNNDEPLPEIPGNQIPPTGNAVTDLKNALSFATTRAQYAAVTDFVAKNAVDPDLQDVMRRPLCSGALRKIDGKFCTVLTTSWESPFTLKQMKEIIDPLNWPDLCEFFVSMELQPPLNPDPSGGWSRVLESVSGDETQWQMRTALRYWKGVSTDGEGIYINYDLDNPRIGDCKLVEVDAGYIWATPTTPGDEDSLVKIRTCKQVRIRGVSATATAAMGCGFGWGDAMSRMFSATPTSGTTNFTPSVPKPAGQYKDPTGGTDPGDQPSDDAVSEAAEEVELIDGWRGAIIEAMRVQLTDGIERGKRLGTKFAVQWSDGEGISRDEVAELGAELGREMTQYATNVFDAAATALQPPPEDATKGNN
ncbi:hypothetical protein [Mycolicibacterium agri]|nr:hypothetical protein [Mycolicibacterium agri]